MSTAEHLIAATRELLWERGYVGTSPRDIQKRSGAGQGSMYHHFAGKRELALAAIEQTVEEMLEKIDAQLAGPGSPLERVTAYLRRERGVLKGCAMGRLTQDPEVMDDAALRRPIELFFAGLRRRVAGLLAEAQACQELPRALDADAVACAMVAVLQGGYVLARAAHSTEPYKRAVEGALALLATQRPLHR